MLHRYIEGERVGDDGDEVVGVDRRRNDGPGGVPAPLGESPPPSSSSFTPPLHGRRVSPLVLGFHGGGGARAPPRLDFSLCFLLFLRSCFLAFHRFLNSQRSVTPIGMKF